MAVSHLAAGGAFLHPPHLIVLQILHHRVVHPAVAANAALAVAEVARHQRHDLAAVVGAVPQPPGVGVGFVLVLLQRHAEGISDLPPGGGRFQKDPVHIRHLTDVGLRDDPSGMHHRYPQVAHPVLAADAVLPVHQQSVAALHGADALPLIVEPLKG